MRIHNQEKELLTAENLNLSKDKESLKNDFERKISALVQEKESLRKEWDSVWEGYLSDENCEQIADFREEGMCGNREERMMKWRLGAYSSIQVRC